MMTNLEVTKQRVRCLLVPEYEGDDDVPRKDTVDSVNAFLDAAGALMGDLFPRASPTCWERGVTVYWMFKKRSVALTMSEYACYIYTHRVGVMEGVVHGSPTPQDLAHLLICGEE